MNLARNYFPPVGIGGAKWLWSDILGNGIGVGNVYIVVNTADTTSSADILAQYQGTYPDGSVIVYEATPATADVAIQAALDSCVANRNDYVLVMPSNTNYSITNSLVMSKKGVHLICPTGLTGNAFPIGNTARLKSIVAATPIIAVSANTEAFEIAGFYLKNYVDVAAITLATGVSAQNIHSNMFPLVWGSNSAVASIVGTGSAGAWGSISNNWWISETGTGHTVAIAAVDIGASATGCRVCNNEITIGDQNVATAGISNQAVKGHTDFNVFSESGGLAAGAGGGSIVKCVSVSVMGCAIGNLGAVVTTHMLTGGTANESYVENFSALNGGTVATS